MEITLNIASAALDNDYGKYDIAPRIMEHESGNCGYLLAYDIYTHRAYVFMDGADGTEYVPQDSFHLIT